MKKCALYLFLFISILTAAESCASKSKVYSYDDKNKGYGGKLSDSTYMIVKQILINAVTTKLKDTLIIKYDYNNETCWNLLDQSSDDQIIGFITRQKERIKTLFSERQYVSVFAFKEPGNNFNKIKMWDSSIFLDSTKQLFNLLFKERSTCGSSIIIMPDKRFVFLRSDAHSEILNLTQNQIEKILSK